MNSVHAYEPGSIIPKIELKLQWKGAGEPEKKAVKIAVEGGSMESFTLFCGEQPPVTPAPTSHPLPQPTPPESGPTSHPLPQPTPPEPRPVAMSDKPTLPQLHNFPTPSNGVIQRVAENSHTLGILLLDDKNGNITANIKAQYRPDQCQIAEEIFRKWLDGTGRTPQTWATLVTVLRGMQMETLANEIEKRVSQ